MRKKTLIITSLAALSLLAVGAGPVLADGMPPGMPDLEETLKSKPALARPDMNDMNGMRHGEERMHGEMMQDRPMAMRETRRQDGVSTMSHRSNGGC
ncbi:MAG: hypothetical protein ABT11_08165 [Novosphingobium sp. SCN 66-18]|nr:MAG: hypothetical protein ABT11_08165 [Novosphingobium sp. SCN 66-18]